MNNEDLNPDKYETEAEETIVCRGQNRDLMAAPTPGNELIR